MIYNQQEFDIRFEWGLRGLEELALISDVVIIVDILSFSTCVDIATSRGATILPYRWKDETAATFAAANNAQLASFNRGGDGYSLSPASLLNIPAGTKLVLPSPNGSNLSLSTGDTPTLCGCFRNAKAVAGYAQSIGNKIAIIAAGEQWPDGSLRAAFEDLAGAGAIISYLPGALSPESKSALATFHQCEGNILNEIKQCISGKELIERGFESDVDLACMLNVSEGVPGLVDGEYARV